MSAKKREKTEYGDFQTPTDLTEKICLFLQAMGIKPNSLIEPTCGKGNFLISVMNHFSSVEKCIGADINTIHIKDIKDKLSSKEYLNRVEIIQEDFFKLDWKSLISQLPEPLVVLGNFPWVNNSSLGVIGSQNLPKKNNFQKHNGFDALTGKSNFDLSEWMLIQVLDWFSKKQGFIAMLCKTSVARKIVLYASQNNSSLLRSSIYLIDAKKYFDASVDACLFVCELGKGHDESGTWSGNPTMFHSRQIFYECSVYDQINSKDCLSTFGIINGQLIANTDCFNQWSHLEGKGKGDYRWRSGIKHDCSKVMELHHTDVELKNGLGENVQIENTYVFPLLKSSNVASNKPKKNSRSVIVTQKIVGEDTQHIQKDAPKTWAYLKKHQDFFEKRKSSIYKGKPSFSIFGIGDYSFAPWKVAISGLYKQLFFSAISPVNNKPVMLDDTCYFIPCGSKEEALLIYSLLNSEIAKQFFASFIFWDAKRPITASILNRLDILKLADELGKGEELTAHLISRREIQSKYLGLSSSYCVDKKLNII